MKFFGKLVVAVGLAALTASPAFAQGRGGFGMMGGMGGGRLLTNKGVQGEIKATEEQASKLNELGQQLTDKGREAFQGFQDLGEEERREKMASVGKMMAEEVEKGIKEILKPEQIKRFHQIEIQQAGHAAFMMPRVSEALKLTDDQKTKLGEVNDGMQGAMREAFQAAAGDREAMMTKMRELRKEAMDKAAALLTDAQKTSWKDLIGAPYEVVFERRPN
jgi:Spy/CpxP family protein refolding chaperone